MAYTAPSGKDDPRTRYFHAAVDVSCFGKNEPKKSPVTGDYINVVEGSPSYNALFTVPLDAVVTDMEIGWLTQGVWMNATALTTHTTTTVALAVDIYDPVTQAVVAAIVVPAGAPATGGATPPLLTPIPNDYIIRVSVAAASAVPGEIAAVTLTVNPATPGWW